MKRLQKDRDFDKILLVSGDGDYKMLIDYLIEESKLEKILFTNKKFRSSLYKEIGAPYFAYLDDRDVKKLRSKDVVYLASLIVLASMRGRVHLGFYIETLLQEIF